MVLQACQKDLKTHYEDIIFQLFRDWGQTQNTEGCLAQSQTTDLIKNIFSITWISHEFLYTCLVIFLTSNCVLKCVPIFACILHKNKTQTQKT